MRRFLGALAVGTSLLLTATVSAQNPEGRVVNSKPRQSVRKLVDRAPADATPTENTPTENTPTENTPTENTPAENTPTDAKPADTTPTDATSTETTSTETIPTEAGRSTLGEASEESSGTATEATEGTVVRTFENIQITEEEKRRAAVGKQAAAAEEQQMTGRIRGLQLLIAKEEQLLAQRMTYAAKLREKGLATNDPKTLDQAEQFERAALAEYQKKIQQFERASVTNSAPVQPRRATQSPRTSKNAEPPRR